MRKNMPLIDTHVHIDYYSSPHQIAKSYEQNKIYTFFVTNLPEVFEKLHYDFQSYKYVRICLGYHPQVCSEFPLDKQLFRKCALHTKYIGEVGLDFKNEHVDIINKQIDAFEFITTPEFNTNKIYSIHSKHTEDIILEILKKNKVKHAILHWYTGKLSTLDKLVNEGYYFSLNPKMTTSQNALKRIERIPPQRILFETDGPFIKYNNELILPNHIQKAYNDFELIIPNFQEIVFQNFRRLLLERDLKNESRM
ncbi:TatD family hydrolase [Lysinibacillus pakistanensis]|uniref:TatD family hydrolase n=1 Tax=Lysinibacillus pakistanensis TaxID=759811 RepID=UPI003D29381A